MRGLVLLMLISMSVLFVWLVKHVACRLHGVVLASHENGRGTAYWIVAVRINENGLGFISVKETVNDNYPAICQCIEFCFSMVDYERCTYNSSLFGSIFMCSLSNSAASRESLSDLFFLL